MNRASPHFDRFTAFPVATIWQGQPTAALRAEGAGTLTVKRSSDKQPVPLTFKDGERIEVAIDEIVSAVGITAVAVFWP